MSDKLLPLLACVILLFSAACSPVLLTPAVSPTPGESTPPILATPEPTATQPSVTPTLPPTHNLDKFLPIIDELAASYGIATQDITLISYEAVDWSDSCLGVYRPGIACLDVITPGYKIFFGTPDRQIEVHTNLEATIYQVLEPGSGIKGQALVGPACPGPVHPGQGCPDQPYQGIIQILDNKENPVAEVTTAEDGTFQVDLPPGDYTLTLPQVSKFPSAAPQPVTVTPGQYAEVKFLLDSGIR